MKNYDFEDPPHAEPNMFLTAFLISILIMVTGGVGAVILALIGGDQIQFNKESAYIVAGVFAFVYTAVTLRYILARRFGKKKSEKIVLGAMAISTILILGSIALWVNLK